MREQGWERRGQPGGAWSISPTAESPRDTCFSSTGQAAARFPCYAAPHQPAERGSSQGSPNPEGLPRVYKWGAPAGDEGGEELRPRLLATGRQGHRAMLTSVQGHLSEEDKETGGQSA